MRGIVEVGGTYFQLGIGTCPFTYNEYVSQFVSQMAASASKNPGRQQTKQPGGCRLRHIGHQTIGRSICVHGRVNSLGDRHISSSRTLAEVVHKSGEVVASNRVVGIVEKVTLVPGFAALA